LSIKARVRPDRKTPRSGARLQILENVRLQHQSPQMTIHKSSH
jgi:hypothetical protein